MKFHPIFRSSFFAVLTVFLLSSCAEQSSTGEGDATTPDSTAVTDKGLLKFQGEIFSIPSPVQTAIMMQQSNVAFDKNVLNSSDNVDKYATENKKALNLGIYGADLAYLSNFKDPALSQKYFEVMGKLAEGLDILENIDQNLLQRFVENMNKRDSLLALNADFYKEGDRYLKKNERHQVAALILLGGWIEALHIACNVAAENPAVRSKVGEQRSALNGLIRVLQHFSDEESLKIAASLTELSGLMQPLESTYTYNKPITDQHTKTTYLTSKTSVVVTDEQLTDITEKVEEIRNTIIQ